MIIKALENFSVWSYISIKKWYTVKVFWLAKSDLYEELEIGSDYKYEIPCLNCDNPELIAKVVQNIQNKDSKDSKEEVLSDLEETKTETEVETEAELEPKELESENSDNINKSKKSKNDTNR